MSMFIRYSRMIVRGIIENNRRIRTIFGDLRSNIHYYFELEQLRKTKFGERFILIGTPEHGNLGDHAIAVAEIEFLRKSFKNRKIIEISGNNFRINKYKIIRHIELNDTILITGGGFLGSLWIIEEQMVRDILISLPKNATIIFPSTIFFEDSLFGEKVKEESMHIYSLHENLTICLRDRASYDLLKVNLNGNEKIRLIHMPDIALNLDRDFCKANRSGILLCFRNDKESALNEDAKSRILDSARKLSTKVDLTDTVLKKRVFKNFRVFELNKKLKEFGKSRLVITDRLHGMVFSFITHTPCIALDNSSGKVFGVYQWIKNDISIRVVKNTDNFEDIIEIMLKCNSISDREINMGEFMKRLITEISGELKIEK